MFKKILKFFFLFIIVAIVFSHIFVEVRSKKSLYNTVDALPSGTVGLVFGTAKTHGGRPNIFFVYRIRTAVEAYKAGKVHKILVSGDNGTTAYNEPEDMKNALVAEGVKEEDIVFDYAGFRTLDSIVRAQKVFGQNSLTVISQEFQNERAIVIGKAHGMTIVGLNTAPVPFRTAPRIYLREYLSRVKLLLDLYLFHTQPKFLGDPIAI